MLGVAPFFRTRRNNDTSKSVRPGAASVRVVPSLPNSHVTTEIEMSARFALIGAAALVGAMAMAPAAASAACRGYVQASAEGTFKLPTELISRARWRSEVRDRYSSAFAFWSKAEDKVTRCQKQDPGDKWRCVARARPCD
jgi:hypothetical protein